MTQARPRFAQAVVRRVDFRITLIRGKSICVRSLMNAIRMNLRRTREKFCLQHLCVQPGTTWLVQQREIIGHQALKLSPQEQLVAALGFFTLKPPSVSAST